MANEQRRRRVEEQIQQELSQILRLEMKDPRVGMITISGVKVSADFAAAKVFYTLLGSAEERELADAGLRSAAGFLRSALGKRLRIHNTPELRFTYDTSIERGVHLSQLIDQAVAGKSATEE